MDEVLLSLSCCLDNAASPPGLLNGEFVDWEREWPDVEDEDAFGIDFERGTGELPMSSRMN
jgi:hypothetical protein